jgi:short-subunit dehydrogenase
MDLYFHSSGIGYQNVELDMERELATVETNAVGMTRMVGAAFHYFEVHPGQKGQIAVISSIAGTKGLGAAPAYSATKRYVNHYLECLTQLCHIRRLRHISIYDIRPGFVRTALISGSNYPLQLDAAKVAQQIVKKIEQRRAIITIDWRYRLLVFFWRLIPRWLWVRMRIA